MSLSHKKRLSLACTSFLLFITLFFGVLVDTDAHPSADTPVECLIVQFSACNGCVLKYRDLVKPFYDLYKDNDSITFTIMDASDDFTYFFDEMQQIGVNIGDYGNFPWVIFLWNESQKHVLDGEDLGLITSTFENILADVGYVPNGNNNTPTTSFDIINLETLLVAFIIILGPFLVFSIAGYYLVNRSKLQLNLLRIDKNRFYIFTGLTLISLVTLTYQLLDYMQGGCGCASTDIAKILLFREYEVFEFFGLEIPFSLLGIALMIIIFAQVLLLSIIPFPIEVPYFSGRTYLLTDKHGGYWYYFIVFQLFMTIGALINLLYLELFVIHFICLLCTLSQIIIVINTIIVITWSPFKTSSGEDGSTPFKDIK